MSIPLMALFSFILAGCAGSHDVTYDYQFGFNSIAGRTFALTQDLLLVQSGKSPVSSLAILVPGSADVPKLDAYRADTKKYSKVQGVVPSGTTIRIVSLRYGRDEDWTPTAYAQILDGPNKDQVVSVRHLVLEPQYEQFFVQRNYPIDPAKGANPTQVWMVDKNYLTPA